MPMEDLSEYERIRLENIRRNNAFLEQLGFSSTKPKYPEVDDPPPLTAIKNAKREVKRKRSFEVDSTLLSSCRRSPRLRNLGDKVVENIHECLSDDDVPSDEQQMIDYDMMPAESTDLDDHEFEVFVELKAWRLLKSRALELEPYKIAQNRTIAELIRRKRNNPLWGSNQLSDDVISTDLVECWGIGPAKAKIGGFGWELNCFLNDSEKLLSHLTRSRDLLDTEITCDESQPREDFGPTIKGSNS